MYLEGDDVFMLEEEEHLCLLLQIKHVFFPQNFYSNFLSSPLTSTDLSKATHAQHFKDFQLSHIYQPRAERAQFLLFLQCLLSIRFK